MTDSNESLKRYQREQERILDDVNARVSPNELIQTIAEKVMKFYEKSSETTAAEQADSAYALTVTLCHRRNGMPLREAEEMAKVVRNRIEVAVWSRQRREPSG